jgi:hypothetical protein
VVIRLEGLQFGALQTILASSNVREADVDKSRTDCSLPTGFDFCARSDMTTSAHCASTLVRLA